jgi:hypothetical protein
VWIVIEEKNKTPFYILIDIPYKERDELNDPGHVIQPIQETEEVLEPRREGQVQTKIMDFFQIREKNAGNSSQTEPTILEQEEGSRPVNTSLTERGYSFCNRRLCRYCPKMNKTGKLTCNVTGQILLKLHEKCFVQKFKPNLCHHMYKVPQTIRWANTTEG